MLEDEVLRLIHLSGHAYWPMFLPDMCAFTFDPGFVCKLMPLPVLDPHEFMSIWTHESVFMVIVGCVPDGNVLMGPMQLDGLCIGKRTVALRCDLQLMGLA